MRRVVAIGGIVLALAAGAWGQSSEFRFHRQNILGTSMDLTVWAGNQAEATGCEAAVLAEIERLRMILSTYEPASEISRLNAAADPVPCSRDLLNVLAAAEDWRKRSNGAFNIQIGQLIDLWKLAEKTGRVPDDRQLGMLTEVMNGPACEIDLAKGTARRRTLLTLNVDALAKGYVLDKAVAAGKAAQAGVTGLLLDIGGDLALFGSGGSRPATPWRVEVADPLHSQENAPPLTAVQLSGRAAVATSGHYARFYKIAGQQFSHILDPRTGRPVQGALSATIVARDAFTADALSTCLCVLDPTDGLRLVAATPGAECLIVAADKKQHQSMGWPALKAPDPPARPAAPAAKDESNWPKGFQLLVALTLVDAGRKAKRPYLAVWIEDAAGRYVRTVSVWGNELKYLKEMTAWWPVGGRSRELVRHVTRASRGAGRYGLIWDGTDDAGRPVPQGAYTVRMEVNREKGRHLKDIAGQIECRDAPAKATIPDNTEIEAITLTYGPPKSD